MSQQPSHIPAQLEFQQTNFNLRRGLQTPYCLSLSATQQPPLIRDAHATHTHGRPADALYLWVASPSETSRHCVQPGYLQRGIAFRQLRWLRSVPRRCGSRGGQPAE